MAFDMKAEGRGGPCHKLSRHQHQHQWQKHKEEDRGADAATVLFLANMKRKKG